MDTEQDPHLENRNGNCSGDKRSRGGYPIRLNLIITMLITALKRGIIGPTFAAITRGGSGENQFIVGALTGLPPTGITGLVGSNLVPCLGACVPPRQFLFQFADSGLGQ